MHGNRLNKDFKMINRVTNVLKKKMHKMKENGRFEDEPQVGKKRACWWGYCDNVKKETSLTWWLWESSDLALYWCSGLEHTRNTLQSDSWRLLLNTAKMIPHSFLLSIHSKRKEKENECDFKGSTYKHILWDKKRTEVILVNHSASAGDVNCIEASYCTNTQYEISSDTRDMNGEICTIIESRYS